MVAPLHCLRWFACSDTCKWQSVEPRLMTTSLLRPYSFDPKVKITESFYYFEEPVNAATLLLWPGFFTQRWFVLTGFHCTNNSCTGFCFWGFLERIVCGLFIEEEVRDLCIESMYNNWRSCQWVLYWCATNADGRLTDWQVNKVDIVVKCFNRFPIPKL